MKRILLVVVLLTVGAGVATAQEDPAGSWTDETSAFYFARGGCATDGAYIYYFGGYQRGVSASYPSYYRRARRYDPATNSWLTLANLPIVTSDITYQYNAGACVGGQLFSFGTSHNGGSGIVLAYSIADDAWSVLNGVTVPDNRYGAAAAVLNGLVYLSGGFSGATTRRTDVFDPSDNSFTRLADLPAALYRHAMVAVPARNSLFVVGGHSGAAYQSTCFEYSAAADTWSERATLPEPKSLLAAFVLRGRIYAVGGHNGSEATASVLEYYPAANSWTPRASMSSARYQHGAVALDERGYVYGGLPVYSEGEEFTPPDFGPGPQLESEVAQVGSQPESSLQATSNPEHRDGWTGQQFCWSATITDPDAGQSVRLRVRWRRPLEPAWKFLESGLVDQGLVQIFFALPTAHPYDWEYRVEDAEGNSIPEGEDAWLPAFGNSNTPDFRCDMTMPSAPVPLSPSESDVGVGDPTEGHITFRWTEAVDNGPASGVKYELEIKPLGPEDPEIVETIPTAGQATITLPVSSDIRFWRIRALDIAGNATPWSPQARFRVVHDDRLNHGAGDAEKSCAFGAAAAPSTPGLLVALLAAMLSYVNRLRRSP